MNFIIDNYNYLLKKYYEIPYTKIIEEKYNITQKIQYWCILTFLLYYLIFGVAVQYVSLIFSLIYPAFQSFISLELEEADKQRRMLLTYWIIISFLITFETVCWFVVSLIPMYYLVKLCFIYWLISPRTKGCLHIYKNILEPKLKENKDKIESFLSKTDNSLTEIGSKIVKNINKNEKKYDKKNANEIRKNE
jgi:receptor expression-enhancing protein 5/6